MPRPQCCVIRAYGEMVDVLWKAGQTAAAIQLEMLWNQLAQTHQFALLCGYSMGNFYKDAAQQEISGLHTHVSSDTQGPIGVVNGAALYNFYKRVGRQGKTGTFETEAAIDTGNAVRSEMRRGK